MGSNTREAWESGLKSAQLVRLVGNGAYNTARVRSDGRETGETRWNRTNVIDGTAKTIALRKAGKGENGTVHVGCR